MENMIQLEMGWMESSLSFLIGKRVSEDFPSAGGDFVGKLDVKVDDEIAPFRGFFGKRESFAFDLLLGAGLDDVVQRQRNLASAQRGDLQGAAAAEGVLEGDFGGVEDVGGFSLKERMRFVAEDEDDVGGDAAGVLVALFGEGDLGAALPSRLDVDRKHFVLGSSRFAVGVEDSARDLHLLRTTRCDILEGDVEVSFYWGVLSLSLRRVMVVSHAVKVVEAVVTPETPATMLTKDVVSVHVFSKVTEMKAGSASSASHHIGERIFATEEGLENLVRIAAELIRVRESRMTAGGKTSGATATATGTGSTTLQPLLTIFVVDLFLLRIRQDVIGFSNLFEFLFCTRRFVFVGMKLQRHFSVTLFNFIIRRPFCDA